jgi:hypothetical protein
VAHLFFSGYAAESFKKNHRFYLSLFRHLRYCGGFSPARRIELGEIIGSIYHHSALPGDATDRIKENPHFYLYFPE